MFRQSAYVIIICLITASMLSNGNLNAQGCSTENDAATHTKVGAQMPSFTVSDTSGREFALSAQRGKVVLINFWATWCEPCQFEIPRIESELWNKYKNNPNFAMIAIAREETAATIVPFRKAKGFTYPIAPDPSRSTYKLFADSGIPRTYVVSPTGKILFQTVGYCSDDFGRIKREIDQALAEKSK
jgi:peroxiredoxin